MRSLPSLVATVVLGAGAAGFAPPAAAGHIVIGIGIGLPGIAYAAPVPLLAAAAPNYYYGTAYYGPGFYGLGYVAAPWYGYRYYGRPYLHYAARGFYRAYAGGARRYR